MATVLEEYNTEEQLSVVLLFVCAKGLNANVSCLWWKFFVT
jgi:hypothetical protein